MSSDEEREADIESVSSPAGLKQYVVGLENRLDAHSTRLDDLHEGNEDLRARTEKLEAMNERLRDRNEELQDEINRLDARTDILQLAEGSDQMSPEQRSITLILAMKNAAENLGDKEGELRRAELAPDEVESVLRYPDLDRTTFYSDMRRAVRLVGNKNVLWYESGYGDAKLKLDLEAGKIPGSILGSEE